MECEKIFVNHIADKGLLSQILKNFTTQNQNPYLRMDKRLEQTFVKSRYSNGNKHRKINIIAMDQTVFFKIHIWLYLETGLSGNN